MSVFSSITRKQLIGAVLLIAFILILYFSLTVVIYFAVSVALTIALSPLMEVLDRVEVRKVRLPDWLKALAGLLSVYVFFYVIFLLIVPPLMRELSAISELSMSEIYKNLERPIQNIEKWADNLGIKPVGYDTNRDYVMAKMSEYLNISNITGTITGLVSVLGNLLVALFSISFITFFLLKERRIAASVVLAFTPDHTTERMARVLSQVKQALQRYITGVILQISLIAIIVSFGLNFFNINNAFIIGLFAGLINVIPYIGPLIGTVVGTLVAFGTTPGLMTPDLWQIHFVKVISVFIVVQLMDNFVFQPLIFSKSVNAHPLEIFFVILIAGNLFGIIGMIVAVPAYSIFRIVGREFLSEYKWIRSITQSR